MWTGGVHSGDPLTPCDDGRRDRLARPESACLPLRGRVCSYGSRARNASRWCLPISRRRPAFTDPSSPVRSRSWTSSLETPSSSAASSGLYASRSAKALRLKISRMMASSSSRMSLASSRAMVLVLISARSAASGTAMSLPCLAECLMDAAGLAPDPVLAGDDGGYVLGTHRVEVEVYLLGSPQRSRLRS